MQFITHKIDNQAALENAKWEDIQTEAAKHTRSRITVESYSEAQELSLQQIKWWKGILLPALSADTGDTVHYWENKLKLQILPDDVQPETIIIDGILYAYLPSISKLSIKKTNLLITGSVQYLRDECGFGWVTLPCSELRKT